MNYKKLFTILVCTFVLFEIGNIFLLLDVFDYLDFGKILIDNDIDGLVIPISQTILFLFGQCLALIMLSRSDVDVNYIKKIKIISLLFIILSPVITIFIPIAFFISTGLPSFAEMEKDKIEFIAAASAFIFLIIVFVSYLIQLHSFNLIWSRARKIIFWIISSIVYCIAGLIILVGTFFGLLLRDRGLS